MRPDLRYVSLPPRVLPGDIPANLEVFASGDVHGQADLLAACLDGIARAPQPPATERLVVFLGDIVDRGLDSLRAIGLIMNASRLVRADRVVLLPGNHELVLLDALDGNAEPWLAIGGKTVTREIDPAWERRSWWQARERLRDDPQGLHCYHPSRAVASPYRRSALRPCRSRSLHARRHPSRTGPAGGRSALGGDPARKLDVAGRVGRRSFHRATMAGADDRRAWAHAGDPDVAHRDGRGARTNGRRRGLPGDLSRCRGGVSAAARMGAVCKGGREERRTDRGDLRRLVRMKTKGAGIPGMSWKGGQCEFAAAAN